MYAIRSYYVHYFFRSVLGNIAASGYQAGFVFQVFIAGRQHLGGKIDTAVARCLWSYQAAAPVEAFTGKDPGKS